MVTPPNDGDSAILIIDDDPIHQQHLRSILEPHHRIVTTGVGEDGIAVAKELHPDLIILDGILPGMDGFEVLWNLRESPITDEIPVIFLTQLGDAGSQVKALEAGATDFVAKPAVPGVLVARIRNQLRLKHALDCLRDASMIDRVTGLANRASFDARLNAEWHRAFRSRRPVSLILADIDNFSEFKETFGESMANQCLRDVAGALAESILRPTDLVARYGWDEFGVILGDTDLTGASVVADRLLECVAKLTPGTSEAEPFRITLSVGMAVSLPAEGGSIQGLLKNADTRMRAAIHEGGNQIHAKGQ